jgi:hypothetical protein
MANTFLVSPKLDEREIWTGLSGGCGHVAMRPPHEEFPSLVFDLSYFIYSETKQLATAHKRFAVVYRRRLYLGVEKLAEYLLSTVR